MLAVWIGIRPQGRCFGGRDGEKMRYDRLTAGIVEAKAAGGFPGGFSTFLYASLH